MRYFILTLLFLVLILPWEGVLAGETYFPLVVYSGEPEGVMAAVAAAREGIKTLLIMEREEPGGLMTYGGLNYLDLNYDQRGKNLNRGLFQEWHYLVGGEVSFSIKQATAAFNQLLTAEENLTVYRQCQIKALDLEAGGLNSLTLHYQGQEIKVKADLFIDASQDADLAVKAGVPSFPGGADIGLPERQMAVTLIIHLGNIHWEKLKAEAISQRYGPTYIKDKHAWGFVRIGQLYQAQDPNIKLRGLNIVRDGDNEVYINSMLIFGVNPLDKASLQEAYQRGIKESQYVLEFLRQKLKGFEEAILLAPPQELYVRESRHILARYQLQVTDLLEEKLFADTIALASYPLDYQASTKDYSGFVLFNPRIYGIPLRSIIAAKINNLLVVGRSSGYSSLAAASARVLPTGMTAGEAAGLAAALAWQKGINLTELVEDKESLNYIQDKLKIKELIQTYQTQKREHLLRDPYQEYINELLSWGLIIGGYTNDFRLEEKISEKEFAHLLIKGLKGRKAPILYEWVPGGLETVSTKQDLTRDEAAKLLLVAVSQRISELGKGEYYSQAQKLALIPDFWAKLVPENRVLNRREAYLLAGYFLQKYPPPAELQLFRGGRL